MKLPVQLHLLALVMTMACGSKRHEPAGPEAHAPAPTQTVLNENLPVTNTGIPAMDSPYESFSENSLVECQVENFLARHCRLKGAQTSIILRDAPASGEVVRDEVEIKCSAGKTNADFSFRLRASPDATAVAVKCRSEEPVRYVLEGHGALELFIENPQLLNVFNFSKNMVLEVISVNGQPFIAK